MGREARGDEQERGNDGCRQLSSVRGEIVRSAMPVQDVVLSEAKDLAGF